MGTTYSIPGTINFQFTGMRWFTAAGYKKNSIKWDPKDLEVDMSGKVCIVTGANSGLGYQVTKELAKRNGTVLMICRNQERGEEAMNKLQEETGSNTLELQILDVSRPGAVRDFVRDYITSGRRLDVLIHNAGALLAERTETSDGLEMTFATHTLGPFLMTEYLLPVLEQSAPSRVITVTSGGMYTQQLDVDNLQSKKKYDGMKAYSQQKRAQVDLIQYWAHKYENRGVTFNCVHPGWTRTPGTQASLPKWFNKLDLRNVEQGADTIVWLAAAEKVKNETGKLWFDREEQRVNMSLAHTQSSPRDVERLYEYCSSFMEPLVASSSSATLNLPEE